MSAPVESRDVARLHVPVGPLDHAAGPEDAAVTLVEYGDYECPYCRRAHPIVKRLRERFGTSLRFVFRNFPLVRSHPHALHAACAAESVAAHAGDAAFWAMHDRVFENQRALADEDLAAYADAVGADGGRVLADLRDGVFEPRVKAEFQGGLRSGVNGTPTFFIDGVRWDGPWSVAEAFAEALEAAGARSG